MENLEIKLMSDLKEAMKNKDKLKKGVLTLLRAALINLEKEKGKKLENDDKLVILKREQKQTRDALNEFRKAGREDLVEENERKLEIIESYMPEQMTEVQIRDYIYSLNIDKSITMGQAIGRIMGELKGKADGSIVSKIVKEYLS